MEGLNMLYFRKNDEVIEKYQIDFNKEEVETLKEKIINNCSFIKHEEYETKCAKHLLNVLQRLGYSDVEIENMIEEVIKR